MKRTVSASLVLTLALALVIPALLQAGAQTPPQTAPKPAANTVAKAPVPKTGPQTVSKVKAPSAPVTIHPAFADLKEKTGVIVFLAWLWLIVGILVWLLRMKIREADRVHALRFYPASKDAPQPPTH